MLFFLAALSSLLVDTVWIRTPAPLAVKVGAPEVHSVEVAEDAVTVRSAGTSLAYLGVLQSSPWPPGSARQFTFRIPRAPRRATDRHTAIGEMAGVFVNGMPIYNQFAAASYQGQNLWHYDPIARGGAPGLLDDLLKDSGGHSPIVGYALDGYPVYGPWGFVDGVPRRMRSGYRLRKITERVSWADGTQLTAGQAGPAVDADAPAGTFAEDYEFVAGSGDLDQYNGRFAVTPEYPNGTYAYFLASDDAGRLAFPYLLAGEFAGVVPGELRRIPVYDVRGKSPVDAGNGVMLRLPLKERVLEYIHEKPVHVMIVSDDLAEFDHIHPQWTDGGGWEVEYTFRHGGRYRVYAEFTAPGEETRTEAYDVEVRGERRGASPLQVSTSTAMAELRVAGPLVAGREQELRVVLSDSSGLEPYLGAWAHFAIAAEGLETFLHAHPLADGEAPMPANCTMHTHGTVSGPPPGEVRTVVTFAAPGLYKVWAQFQVAGRVEVAPFVVRVEPDGELPARAAQQ